MNEDEHSSVPGDEPGADADEQHSPPSRSFVQRLSGWVSWLALALAVVALAAVLYDVVADRLTAGNTAATDESIATLTASMGATQDAVASLEESVSSLVSLDAERNTAIERLGRQLDDRLRNLEAMPGRIAAVEGSLASLQGISAGARDAWLLAEAEYYMQIANAQLQLAGNPELAMQALGHADDRLVQLADPRLTGVRQALSDELRSLEVLETPDIAGITLTLASLAGVIDSLPLRDDEEEEQESGTAATDPELTGLDRVKASFGRALESVVQVEDVDDDVGMPFIAPEARYFLRANLALQLQVARLALLRGEDEVFRQSLDDADAWLEAHYAQESDAVAAARATIEEVRSSVLQATIPDISQSLRLLRQLRAAGTTSGERPAAESGPEQ